MARASVVPATSRRRFLGLLAGALAGSLGGSATVALARAVAAGPVDEAAAFLAAVAAGRLEDVRRQLDARPALARATDAAGRSAFVIAHLAGHRPVAALLVERGLELDLVESVLAEDWERVERLVAEDPAALDRAHPIGGSVLYGAALAGTPDLYRLRKLGSDPDGRPPGGRGHTPARGALDGRDAVDVFCTLTDLLGNGSAVDAAQEGGDSVLHGAVRRRDARLVRLVVRKGGDVGHRDAQGRTPRELAEALDWSEGVALLADHAAIPRDCHSSRFAYDAQRAPVVRPDLSDVPRDVQEQVTGFSHFAFDQLKGVVGDEDRLVFSISADAELAIEACGHTGNRPIMRWHLERGAPLSLPTAVSLGEVDFVRFLLDDDPARIHERGPHDFPPMWYPAIGGGSVELAELLLERGAPVDQESLGNTGLHWAVVRDDADLVSFLIEHGADLHAVGYKFDRAGQTPLQLARARGRDAIARLLVDRGART